MKNSFCALLIFVSFGANAQLIDLLKKIGEAIESTAPPVVKGNTRNSASTNEKNAQVINEDSKKLLPILLTDDEQFGDFTKSNIDEAKISHAVSASAASIKGTFDIKGLTIGMPLSEAREKIRLSLEDVAPNPRLMIGCNTIKTALDRSRQSSDGLVSNSGRQFGGYVFGDTIIACQRAYVYFGMKLNYAEFFFAKSEEEQIERLVRIQLGTIPAGSSREDDLSDLLGALVNKFGISPERVGGAVREPNRNQSRVENFIWTDEVLSHFWVQRIGGALGELRPHYAIYLSAKDFYSNSEKRRKLLKETQTGAVKEQIQKKSRDL